MVRISYFAVFLWFTILLMKVNFLVPIRLFDRGASRVTWYGRGVTVPQAKSVVEMDAFSHATFVSMDASHVIRVDGDETPLEELGDRFRRAIRYDPQVVAYLIIDRNCKMQHVSDLVQALGTSGMRRILFVSSSKAERKST